jgi:hypothetical protein
MFPQGRCNMATASGRCEFCLSAFPNTTVEYVHDDGTRSSFDICETCKEMEEAGELDEPQGDATRMTETPDPTADDLVTEEIVKAATMASLRANSPFAADNMLVALRAVAPMIAARAVAAERAHWDDEEWAAGSAAVAAEREAIAQMVEGFGNDPKIAAAIRARGET